MSTFRFILGVAATVCALPLVAPATSATNAFYVSPNGQDSNTGTQSSPFASLARAQNAVRQVNGNMQSNINVYVGPGTYYLSQPLVFTSADSGSNGRRIVWQATDPVAGASISGGSQVTGWSLYDSSKGIYVASVPSGSKSRHLYVNQKHAQRARTGISRTSLQLVQNGFVLTDSSTQYLTSLPGIEGGELRGKNSFTDRYLPIAAVSGSTLIMANPAFNNNIIGYDTFTNPDHDNGCWVENVLGLLDEENEYFLDEGNSKVYYKPYAGSNINQQSIILPRLEQVLIVAGTYATPVHDITFQGFNYMHTTWNQPSSDLGYVDQQTGGYIGKNQTYTNFEAARPFWYQVPGSVQVSAANNISFRNGSMQAVMGGFGIGNDPNAHAAPGVGLGASNIDITGMLFMQTGANAITAGGIQANAHHPSDVRMTNKLITIQENIFYDQQYTISSGVPIFVPYVAGATIIRNDISNVPYSAICYGYGWGSNDAGGSDTYKNRGLYNYQPVYTTPTTQKNGYIAYNLIQNYGTIHNDLGGIYTLSKSPNTTIQYNWIVDYQGWPALYRDEGSRDYVDSYSVFQTGGNWYNRNEYGGNTAGNLTAHDLYVYNANTQVGTNGYGDRVYNVTSFSSYSQLPQQFQDITSQAGLPVSERNSRPVPARPN